ncbi:Type 1 glutamine amidotransferase-like domain-containing protein [Bacillus sp. FJAT-53711]|uniref:Type 1 glutamine amidotransferase-like domain-containing protein n=1 Tax=Bacillus yunxiaonensis TaxID=3127665 RepID=A0ABU8FTR8_9BACI
MSKLLLTSNGFFTEQIKKQFLQLTDEEPSDLKVSIITTASPLKENNQYAKKAKEDFIQMGFHTIDFTDIEYDEPETLRQYDVIYINGGNPFYLLYHMKKSGSDLVLKDLANKNIIIVGVSAGAIILGPSIDVVNYFTPQMNTVNIQDLTALGLTDTYIFPHYDREDLFPDSTGKTIEDRLKTFETLNKCTVVRVSDNQPILIDT